MTRIFRQQWPLAAAIIIFWATISVLFFLSTGRTQGHFIYALDDPFIHMAMAKNFAARGVWGFTKYEFSSSTSSILWTLLISFCYLLAGTRELIPFFLNVVFATLVIVAAYLILKSFSISLLQIFLLLVAIVFLTPLPTLVFSGMEHPAQIFIDTCFVFLAAKIPINQDGPDADKDTYILLALAPLVTAIRYEGLFLIIVVALLFLLGGRVLYAATLCILALLPLVIMGFVSVSHGAFWLPNSVLLKGNLPTRGATGLLAHAANQIIAAPHLLTLLILAVCVYFLRRRSDAARGRAQFMLLVFTGTTVLHLSFAAVGWFFRYEAYLVALGILTIFPLLFEILRSASPSKQTITYRSPLVASVLLISLIAVVLLTARGAKALWEMPRASAGIYAQHYQMGMFLKNYYQGESVAANDIGAISYYADIRCLDLGGLGSTEVTRDRLAGRFDTRRMAELARAHQVKIAIIYPTWFAEYGGVPAEWIKVGQWRVTNCPVCGSDIIGFYALDPAEEVNLANHLREFSSSLPSTVEQSGEYLSGQ